MGITALHRVHWVMIAIVLGLIFGVVFDHTRGQLYGVNMGGYGLLLSGQQQFENGLTQEYDHIRLFSDSVVYPHWVPNPNGGTKKVYLVTGRYWDGNAVVKDGKSVAEWLPRCVITQTPYRPQVAVVEPNGKSVAEFPSVIEFLDAMHRQYGVKYRYAWWAAHPMLTWFLGTLIVIGGIWPTVINLLAFGRLTRPPEAKTLSLWNVVSPKPPQKAPAPSFAAPHDADVDPEVEAAMAAAAADAPQQPVASLAGGPLEVLPEGPREAREYGADSDDFYPTERHKHGGHPHA
ncbi:MAG TPA: hypothetical protein VGI81_03845 [Tepidisphaeraceae bacterium]